MGKLNDFFTKLTNVVGGYLIKSEKEAGYRAVSGKYSDPVQGTQGTPDSRLSFINSHLGVHAPLTAPASAQSVSSTSSGSSSSSPVYVASSAPAVKRVYEGAPLAKSYGMDQATAYQEALANSAHQREIADLKAAGLNPVLSATGGSGADVFGGTVYAPASSGSSGSSAKSEAVNATAIGNIVGGLVGLASPRLGNAAGKLAKGLASTNTGKALIEGFQSKLSK